MRGGMTRAGVVGCGLPFSPFRSAPVPVLLDGSPGRKRFWGMGEAGSGGRIARCPVQVSFLLTV